MKVLENIQKDIDNFKADTLSLEKFLTGTRVSYDFFQDKYPEIRSEFYEKVRSESEKEGMYIFENLNDSVANYKKEILKYCFINLIARTDAFLNDFAQSIYLWRKPSLSQQDRDKDILKYSHSSFKNKLKHLKKEFNLVFPHIEEKEAIITELFSTRNIILHNNSVVNEIYLKNNQNSSLAVGAIREIDEDYLKLTFVMAVIIAKTAQEQVVQKAGQSE